jgi:hypothetical protein
MMELWNGGKGRLKSLEKRDFFENPILQYSFTPPLRRFIIPLVQTFMRRKHNEGCQEEKRSRRQEALPEA